MSARVIVLKRCDIPNASKPWDASTTYRMEIKRALAAAYCAIRSEYSDPDVSMELHLTPAMMNLLADSQEIVDYCRGCKEPLVPMRGLGGLPRNLYGCRVKYSPGISCPTVVSRKGKKTVDIQFPDAFEPCPLSPN